MYHFIHSMVVFTKGNASHDLVAAIKK